MQANSINPLEAADSLRSLIFQYREETEANRQLAPPIVEGLIANRLGRLVLSSQYGGLETSAPETLSVFESLAEAEASVAWIVWNSCLPCWLARFLQEEVRAEIFDDHAALFASSTRPSGAVVKSDDSYLINGRWSLVSGCMLADWIPVMGVVEVGGEVQMLAPNVPHMRMSYVKREEHDILDTWHVGGLRGTGSHDTVLSNVSVAENFSFAMGNPSLLDAPEGRIPIVCTMSAGCASICIGILNGALQALKKLAAEKTPVDGGPGPIERASVQALVAEAETLVLTMRERLRTATTSLWEVAASGEEFQPEDIAAVFAASIMTSQECRRLVTAVYAAAGISALYTDCPIERGHRDIHAVMQHIVLQPFWLEQAGRVQMGLEPTHPLFLF